MRYSPTRVCEEAPSGLSRHRLFPLIFPVRPLSPHTSIHHCTSPQTCPSGCRTCPTQLTNLTGFCAPTRKSSLRKLVLTENAFPDLMYSENLFHSTAFVGPALWLMRRKSPLAEANPPLC